MPRVAATPDVRNAILEAATALMERFGYQKMTIDDIAREAGIGKATIYGYYANKQEVGLAVIDHYQREVRERQRVIVGQDGLPKDRLRALVVERVMSAFEIASRYRQSVDESLAALKPLVIRRRGRFGEEEAALMAEVIEQGMAGKEFAPGNARELAHTILTCASGLMPYSLSSKELSERGEVLRQVNAVMDLILSGLANGAKDDTGRSQTDQDFKSN